MLGTVSNESHMYAYRYIDIYAEVKPVKPEPQSPKLRGTVEWAGSSEKQSLITESEPGSDIKCHLKQRR